VVRTQKEFNVSTNFVGPSPDFPTMAEVDKASREQLAKWYRFLPSGDRNEQQRVLARISERFKELGGMTPALSKKMGL
jgi:hypothetical protein